MRTLILMLLAALTGASVARIYPGPPVVRIVAPRAPQPSGSNRFAVTCLAGGGSGDVSYTCGPNTNTCTVMNFAIGDCTVTTEK